VSARSHQTGVALFTAVFLVTAVGVLAISVGVIASQQQIATAQSLDQTQAYYAARARLDREIAALVSSPGPDTCPAQPGTNNNDVAGFTTEVDDCEFTDDIDEGGDTYDVYTLKVRAFRGSAGEGTRVQRSIDVQVKDDS
jgi:Tfp pilus assembly protein PilX